MKLLSLKIKYNNLLPFFALLLVTYFKSIVAAPIGHETEETTISHTHDKTRTVTNDDDSNESQTDGILKKSQSHSREIVDIDASDYRGEKSHFREERVHETSIEDQRIDIEEKIKKIELPSNDHSESKEIETNIKNSTEDQLQIKIQGKRNEETSEEKTKNNPLKSDTKTESEEKTGAINEVTTHLNKESSEESEKNVLNEKIHNHQGPVQDDSEEISNRVESNSSTDTKNRELATTINTNSQGLHYQNSNEKDHNNLERLTSGIKIANGHSIKEDSKEESSDESEIINGAVDKINSKIDSQENSSEERKDMKIKEELVEKIKEAVENDPPSGSNGENGIHINMSHTDHHEKYNHEENHDNVKNVERSNDGIKLADEVKNQDYTDSSEIRESMRNNLNRESSEEKKVSISTMDNDHLKEEKVAGNSCNTSSEEYLLDNPSKLPTDDIRITTNNHVNIESNLDSLKELRSELAEEINDVESKESSAEPEDKNLTHNKIDENQRKIKVDSRDADESNDESTEDAEKSVKKDLSQESSEEKKIVNNIHSFEKEDTKTENHLSRFGSEIKIAAGVPLVQDHINDVLSKEESLQQVTEQNIIKRGDEFAEVERTKEKDQSHESNEENNIRSNMPNQIYQAESSHKGKTEYIKIDENLTDGNEIASRIQSNSANDDSNESDDKKSNENTGRTEIEKDLSDDIKITNKIHESVDDDSNESTHSKAIEKTEYLITEQKLSDRVKITNGIQSDITNDNSNESSQSKEVEKLEYMKNEQKLSDEIKIANGIYLKPTNDNSNESERPNSNENTGRTKIEEDLSDDVKIIDKVHESVDDDNESTYLKSEEISEYMKNEQKSYTEIKIANGIQLNPTNDDSDESKHQKSKVVNDSPDIVEIINKIHSMEVKSVNEDSNEFTHSKVENKLPDGMKIANGFQLNGINNDFNYTTNAKENECHVKALPMSIMPTADEMGSWWTYAESKFTPSFFDNCTAIHTSWGTQNSKLIKKNWGLGCGGAARKYFFPFLDFKDKKMYYFESEVEKIDNDYAIFQSKLIESSGKELTKGEEAMPSAPGGQLSLEEKYVLMHSDPDGKFNIFANCGKEGAWVDVHDSVVLEGKKAVKELYETKIMNELKNLGISIETLTVKKLKFPVEVDGIVGKPKKDKLKKDKEEKKEKKDKKEKKEKKGEKSGDVTSENIDSDEKIKDGKSNEKDTTLEANGDDSKPIKKSNEEEGYSKEKVNSEEVEDQH